MLKIQKIRAFYAIRNMLEKISMKAAYVLFFLAVTLAIETATPGKKVLAILENDEFKSSHSLFFENLKSELHLPCR